MLQIDAVKCDIKTTHPPKYMHNQKNNPYWLIMCFQTPFVYKHNGKTYTGQPGDCLINSPGIPVSHGPAADMDIGFQNDWIYISGTGISDFIETHNIPVNIAFNVGNPNFLTASIQAMMYEKLNKEPFFEEKISTMVQAMMVDVARCIAKKPAPFNKHSEKFNEIRNSIFTSVEKEWTLEQMAEFAGYSVSRFSYLYKKIFKKSPSSDLLHMRIQKAKNMLSYSDISIGQIAEKSGFSSDHHFSYAFKKITNITPSEYRAKNKFFRD